MGVNTPKNWPGMSEPERVKVYKDLSDTYSSRKALSEEIMNDSGITIDLETDYQVNKPKESAVSNAIKQAVEAQYARDKNSFNGMTPKQVMLRCLKNLLEDPRNKVEGRKNIDKVALHADIKIYQNDDGEWKIKVIEEGDIKMDLWLFPKEEGASDEKSEDSKEELRKDFDKNHQILTTKIKEFFDNVDKLFADLENSVDTNSDTVKASLKEEIAKKKADLKDVLGKVDADLVKAKLKVDSGDAAGALTLLKEVKDFIARKVADATKSAPEEGLLSEQSKAALTALKEEVKKMGNELDKLISSTMADAEKLVKKADKEEKDEEKSEGREDDEKSDDEDEEKDDEQDEDEGEDQEAPEDGEDEKVEETMKAEMQLAVNQILPEFAGYLTYNPHTHFFDYNETFSRLPDGKQREIKNTITLKLSTHLNEAVANGIDAKIAAAKNPEEKAKYEAAKALMVEHNPTKGREKLKLAGKEGAEMLEQMNHEYERVRNAQLLSMFEAMESSNYEDLEDDWAASKWMSEEKYTVGKERIAVIRNVTTALKDLFENNPEALATIDDALQALIDNPDVRPSNISVDNVQAFQNYWGEFKEGKGKAALEIKIDEDNFMEQFSEATAKEWLELAKSMKDKGQYEQAEQILRSILSGHKKQDGEEAIADIPRNRLSEETKNEAMKEIREKITEKTVQENLEKEGILTQEGLANIGLYNETTGEFYHPVTRESVTELAAKSAVIQFVRENTIQSIYDKQLFKLAAKADLFDNLKFNKVEAEAWEIFKDLEGIKLTDIADKWADFILEELAISVALIALSATGVGLLALGARAGAFVSGGMRGLGIAARVTKMVGSASKLTRMAGRGLQFGGRIGAFSVPLIIDGMVFHTMHSAISTPMVGARAFDDFGTGLAHGAGLYLAFGAGNAVWNAGMRLGAKLPGVAGRTANALQVRSLREAWAAGTGFRGTARSVAIAFAARQPALALEAWGLTEANNLIGNGTDDQRSWENFAKNYATLNLLWGLTGAQKPGGAKEVGKKAGEWGEKGGKKVKDTAEKYGKKAKNYGKKKLDAFKEGRIVSKQADVVKTQLKRGLKLEDLEAAMAHPDLRPKALDSIESELTVKPGKKPSAKQVELAKKVLGTDEVGTEPVAVAARDARITAIESIYGNGDFAPGQPLDNIGLKISRIVFSANNVLSLVKPPSTASTVVGAPPGPGGTP